MIKAVFFDTSDTLYHSPDFEKAQSELPIRQLSEIKNISLDEAKRLFKEKKEELKSTTVHVTKVAVMMEFGVSRVGMHEYFAEKLDAKDYLSPDPELNKLLQKLKEDYKLGIITNIIKKFLFNILGALELEKDLFTHIVSVDNTKNSKPHEEPFVKAIELSGFKPAECVYVGDSLTKDMIPAKRSGMKTIWVNKESKDDENVDTFINLIYEIKKGVNKL